MILPMNTKFPFRFVPLTLALLLIAARETAGTKVVNLVASTNVTLFVAPSGSDTASGLSATDPLRTVSAAVSVANDRLYHAKASRVDVRLAPGAYAVVSDRAPFPISVSPGVHFWGDVVTGSAGVVWTFSGPGLEVAESSFQGIVFRNMSRDGAVKVTRNGASRYASSIAKFSNCSFEGSTDSHGASIGIAVVTDLHKTPRYFYASFVSCVFVNLAMVFKGNSFITSAGLSLQMERVVMRDCNTTDSLVSAQANNGLVDFDNVLVKNVASAWMPLAFGRFPSATLSNVRVENVLLWTHRSHFVRPKSVVLLYDNINVTLSNVAVKNVKYDNNGDPNAAILHVGSFFDDADAVVAVANHVSALASNIPLLRAKKGTNVTLSDVSAKAFDNSSPAPGMSGTVVDCDAATVTIRGAQLSSDGQSPTQSGKFALFCSQCRTSLSAITLDDTSLTSTCN